jgi:hypothetical protein
MRKRIAIAALLFAVPRWAPAQNADHHYHGQGYLFLADGASNPASYQFGGGGEWLFNKGFGLASEIERSTQFWSGTTLNTWIGSTDLSYHFGSSTKNRKLEPFVTSGYTFFYVSGITLPHDNGANFGGGLNIWLKGHAALRLEIRDSFGGRNASAEFEPSGTTYLLPQHLVSFRIGVTFR